MTEDRDRREHRPDLDLLPAREIVDLLLTAESRVVPAVQGCSARLAEAADLVAQRLGDGGRLVLAGAGTSGRLAWAEAAELPGTFGLDRSRVAAVVAGGVDSTDDDEDDLEHAAADLGRLECTARDVVVCVAASGSTPYTLRLAEAARAAGAAVVAVVNTAGSPLARLADVAVEITTGPEVLRGSSRLTAGTAQKVALNAITTAAMARLGRVHGDLMVDVVPANAKLRLRSAGIVAEIAQCPVPAAITALQACGDDARAAVLHLVLGIAPDEARRRAAQRARLRDALATSAEENSGEFSPDA